VTAMSPPRILLSPPDVGPLEREALLDALDSGWIAPLGPQVDAFEAGLAAACGVPAAAALSSGTAALHLALALADVGRGDEVFVPTLTFAATANAATYLGARCTFVDSEPTSWNLDPGLVLEGIDRRRRGGRLPAAVVTVDLYGQAADHDPIVARCNELGIPVIEDAAEALGATYRGRPAGALGDLGALSFNGNKLITTSGGGALLGPVALADRARWLASQAREPAAHYEHQVLGFNYRMSNLLAGVGCAQLQRLAELVAARRRVNARYREAFAGWPGVELMPVAPWGEPNGWLSVVALDPAVCGVTPSTVCRTLVEAGIEARPAWKPMHLQKLYAASPLLGSGRVAERVFERGVCLPSGSSLSVRDQDEVIERMLALVDERAVRRVS
jgi:dTDP-4-amino-4,6-dideoxygalactose transaminase